MKAFAVVLFVAQAVVLQTNAQYIRSNLFNPLLSGPIIAPPCGCGGPIIPPCGNTILAPSNTILAPGNTILAPGNAILSSGPCGNTILSPNVLSSPFVAQNPSVIGGPTVIAQNPPVVAAPSVANSLADTLSLLTVSSLLADTLPMNYPVLPAPIVSGPVIGGCGCGFNGLNGYFF